MKMDIPGLLPDFEIKSAKFSAVGWDDGHRPSFESRPAAFL